MPTSSTSPKARYQVCFIIIVLGVATVLSIVYLSLTNQSPYSSTRVTKRMTTALAMRAVPRPIDDAHPQVQQMVSYLLVSQYHDQLTNALRWFARIVGVSAALNRQPLVPFVSQSHLYGIPDPESSDYTPLTELYDSAAVETNLRQCLPGLPPSFSLSTLKEFVSTVKTGNLTTFELVSSKKHGIKLERIVDCYQYNISMQQSLQRRLRYLNKYAYQLGSVVFTVVKRVCILTKTIAVKDLVPWIRGQSTAHVLLHLDGVKPTLNIHTTCGGKVSTDSCCHVSTWPVSYNVLNTVEKVSKQQGLHKPYTAVHIRLERLVRGASIAQSLKCVKKLKQILQSLDTMQTILVHDMGDYGTGSCGQGSTCHRDAMTVLSEVKKIGLREFQYKPGRGEIQNIGFVSLVEKEILAEADLLVTMGGGYFQTSVKNHFLLTHNQTNTYTVC